MRLRKNKRVRDGYFRGYWNILTAVYVVQSIEEFFVFFGDEKIFSATASFQFRASSDTNFPSSFSKVILFYCIYFFLCPFQCDLILMSNPALNSTGFQRLVRRELSSLQPVHSVIASACLVSKLPSEAITSTEGILPPLSLLKPYINVCAFCVLQLSHY